CRLSTGASLGSALRRRCVTLGNTEHVRSRSPNSGRCYHEETGMHLRPCNIDSSAPAQPVVDLTTLHRVSIVVPVYRGEKTLGPLLEEIVPLTQVRRTPRGHLFQVAEVILVHDGAVDGSDRVMEMLAERYPFVRPVWLSKNFGQHPATLAGMACTTGEWV